MERDIAYKCSFCDVIFMEFESMLKHNRYYCHKRKSLPRSSTVTTAMLASFQSAGGCGTSQDSSSTSHSPKSTAVVSRAEPTCATTSEKSPQAGYSKDTTALLHERAHSTAPGAAANFKPETNVVVRYNQEPEQSSVPEGTTDSIKHPTSAAIASQPLPPPFRHISDLIHPTSAAITLQRLHAIAKDVLTDFQSPTSAATAQNEPMDFRVPEFTADGRLTSGSSPFKREHMDSDVLNVGEEDSELLESGSKRRKLSDEDELE